jgi:glycosyltransferase involved in cell wall biosynthesis
MPARDRAPRIAMLVLWYPPAYGGSGTQAARLARALAARGARVRVLTARVAPAPAGRSREDGVEVLRFRCAGSDRVRDLWLGVRAAAWLAAHSDWDVLHLHGFSHFALAPSWVARARRRPVLVKTTLLGGDDPTVKGRGWSGGLLLAAYRSCSAVVGLSQTLVAELRRDGHFAGRIAEIPNGVDVELFRPADARARAAARAAFGLAADACVVVTAGELGRRKNATGLVEAVGRVSAGPLALVLAGPVGRRAGEAAELDEAIAALPPTVRVVRPGQLAPDRMAELYRAADVFVLASRAEGLPNALLEAMASGLACVATDIPGSRDALAHGGGLLVAAEDRDALARAIDGLAGNAPERSRLGAQARRVIEERYALGRVAERYLELYAGLLGAGSPEPARA